MTLMKLSDFTSRPCVLEYLALYFSSSAFIIISSASILGNLSHKWAWLSFAVLLICAAVLSMLKQIRAKRAEAFYKEWLCALSEQDIYRLNYRLKDKCPEKQLVSKLLK